jgi:hypothetical protein
MIRLFLATVLFCAACSGGNTDPTDLGGEAPLNAGTEVSVDLGPEGGSDGALEASADDVGSDDLASKDGAQSE